MKRKLALSGLVLVSMAFLFAPGFAKAQDTADIFTKYTNPHDVCNFYRSSKASVATANGQVRPVVERESDNECLTSLGTGKYKTFTQFYYSGNNWCWQMYQNSQSIYKSCVQRPDKSNMFSDKLSSYINDESIPYIIGGIVIFVIIITIASSHKPPVEPTLPEASDQDQVPSEKPPEYKVPHSVSGKTYKPKTKSKRIWDDSINAKPGHKPKK